MKVTCPDCKRLFSVDNYKKRILFELSLGAKNPTQLKDVLECSSFGTIAYHLKNLEEDGRVIKKKFINLRGQPTIYKLKNKQRCC